MTSGTNEAHVAAVPQVDASLIRRAVGAAGADATFPSFFAEMFPTKVRYSGFALSFNVGIALFGGTAPFVATFLIARTGSTFAPGFYLMAFAVVALVAVLLTTETAGKRLRDV